jgi:HSP20 family protein
MAELVRWSPARDMVSLREAMDRLFEESFLRPGLFGGGETPASALPLDMYETENDVVVKASVPGVKPEDIEVTVTGDLLTIKGEFKSEERTEKQNFIRQERRYGNFCRQLGLPVSVDSGKAEASFENGILTLNLPKVEAVKPKTVKVVAK